MKVVIQYILCLFVSTHTINLQVMIVRSAVLLISKLLRFCHLAGIFFVLLDNNNSNNNDNNNDNDKTTMRKTGVEEKEKEEEE